MLRILSAENPVSSASIWNYLLEKRWKLHLLYFKPGGGLTVNKKNALHFIAFPEISGVEESQMVWDL